MAERVRRRTSWPWWGRLLAWVVVLGLGVTGFVALVDTGSAATTRYSPASSPLAAPQGAVAAQVAEATSQALDDTGAPVLSGPTVATYDATGVTGRDARTGAVVWSYHRPDAAYCAGGATRDLVVLVVGRAGRCDEAIGLDAADGSRRFQRTIEAGTPSAVTVDGYSLLAHSARRLSVIDLTSGYERFFYDAPAGTQDDPNRCEILDVAGDSTVNVLQRCRVASTDPWSYAVVAMVAKDGKGSETARYEAGTQRPDLVGTLSDGSAIVTAPGGGVLVASARGAAPGPLVGIDASSGTAREVVRGGLGDLVVVGGQVYALDSTRTAVAWQAASLAVPAVLPDTVAVLAADGRLRFLDFGQGATRSTSTLSPVPTLSGTPRLSVVGDIVCLSVDDRVTTYA